MPCKECPQLLYFSKGTKPPRTLELVWFSGHLTPLPLPVLGLVEVTPPSKKVSWLEGASRISQFLYLTNLVTPEFKKLRVFNDLFKGICALSMCK